MRITYLRQEQKFIVENTQGMYFKDSDKRIGLTSDVNEAKRYDDIEQAEQAAQEYHDLILYSKDGYPVSRTETAAIMTMICLGVLITCALVMLAINYVQSLNF